MSGCLAADGDAYWSRARALQLLVDEAPEVVDELVDLSLSVASIILVSALDPLSVLRRFDITEISCVVPCLSVSAAASRAHAAAAAPPAGARRLLLPLRQDYKRALRVAALLRL